MWIVTNPFTRFEVLFWAGETRPPSILMPDRNPTANGAWGSPRSQKWINLRENYSEKGGHGLSFPIRSGSPIESCGWVTWLARAGPTLSRIPQEVHAHRSGCQQFPQIPTQAPKTLNAMLIQMTMWTWNCNNPAKGSSSIKKTVKKGDIVHTWGGVNPSSLIKPKLTGSSNHPEMDSRHHNMDAMPQGWLG